MPQPPPFELLPPDHPLTIKLCDDLHDNFFRTTRLTAEVRSIDRQLEDIHWFTWLWYSPILHLQRHIHVTNITRLVHQRSCLEQHIYRPPPEHED